MKYFEGTPRQRLSTCMVSILSSFVAIRSLQSIEVAFLIPQTIPYAILLLDDSGRQSGSNAKKHEQCPLPSEGVDQYNEAKPIDQLGIGEEIESSGWCQRLECRGHIDPSLHPPCSGRGQRIGEEHEQQSGVDADVIVADRPATVSTPCQ